MTCPFCESLRRQIDLLAEAIEQLSWQLSEEEMARFRRQILQGAEDYNRRAPA